MIEQAFALIGDASTGRFLAVIKIRINRPYRHWRPYFDEHASARKALGIEDVFCAPVVGEQAVVYVVRTAFPRMIHDMMYEPEAYCHISESGHVLGEEVFTLCEDLEK